MPYVHNAGIQATISPQAPPQANLATASSAPSNSWYPDSGASHHVINVSQNIQQLTPFKGPDQITIGNGQGLDINSTGLTSFQSPLNPVFPLILSNLLFVPSITKNLISVSQFFKDNLVYFEFHPTFCLVKSQVSKEVLLKGLVGLDGLYQFPNLLQLPKSKSSVNTIVCSTSSSETVTSSTNNTSVGSSAPCAVSSFATCNARLGHSNADVMKIVSNICKIPSINKTISEFCSHCCVGKSHRLPSSPSLPVYSTPFELVFTDLWGRAPFLSNSDYSYYVIFVDANTRFTWIYLLKNKSETLDVFKHFKSMVNTQFNFPIKAVQSD